MRERERKRERGSERERACGDQGLVTVPIGHKTLGDLLILLIVDRSVGCSNCVCVSEA